MKKLSLFLVAALFIGMGSLYFLKGKGKVIKVTPINNVVLPHTPYKGFAFAEEAEKEGYRFEWLLLDSLPKKREILNRAIFFIQNLSTKKVLVNNLTPPFSKASLSRIPKEKLVLISWEPPSVFLHQYQKEALDLFGTVLTWDDSMVDGKKFIKYNYPALRPLQKDLPPFEERKFLCMIASNLKINKFEKELYSKRKDGVKFFESKPEGTFDLYGKWWEEFKNAKGTVPDKFETLKEYKFNFCFENANVPGYITEKIFDSFAVGAIPIYLGATNIEEYIPTDCFIDYRQFNSFDEMLTFIQNISKEDYESYLSNIKVFLDSPASKQFTWNAFSDTLSEVLNK